MPVHTKTSDSPDKNVANSVSGKREERFDSGTKQRRAFPDGFHCGYRGTTSTAHSQICVVDSS